MCCKARGWPSSPAIPEKIVLACLLHDIAIMGFIRCDHGYWGAEMVAPYVDEEISWAIRAHQVLRFFPDPAYGYEYPAQYIRLFGEGYRPEPYIYRAYEKMRQHKWYMTARLITVNDIYSFDPNVKPVLEDFTDIIGRNFRQPEEGLGFDDSRRRICGARSTGRRVSYNGPQTRRRASARLPRIVRIAPSGARSHLVAELTSVTELTHHLLHRRRRAGGGDARLSAGARRRAGGGAGKARRFLPRFSRRHDPSLDAGDHARARAARRVPQASRIRRCDAFGGEIGGRHFEWPIFRICRPRASSSPSCRNGISSISWRRKARRFPTFDLRMGAEATDLIEEDGRDRGRARDRPRRRARHSRRSRGRRRRPPFDHPRARRLHADRISARRSTCCGCACRAARGRSRRNTLGQHRRRPHDGDARPRRLLAMRLCHPEGLVRGAAAARPRRFPRRPRRDRAVSARPRAARSRTGIRSSC